MYWIKITNLLLSISKEKTQSCTKKNLKSIICNRNVIKQNPLNLIEEIFKYIVQFLYNLFSADSFETV